MGKRSSLTGSRVILPDAIRGGATADSTPAWGRRSPSPAVVTARWCATLNPSGCAASMRAISRPDRMRWRSTRIATPTRSSPTRLTSADFMHALIGHFAGIAADMAVSNSTGPATKQAAPFMLRRAPISYRSAASLDRRSTKNSERTNLTWYRFDRSPHVYARSSRRSRSGQGRFSTTRHSLCTRLREAYRSQRSNSKFCSDLSATRVWNSRDTGVTPRRRRVRRFISTIRALRHAVDDWRSVMHGIPNKSERADQLLCRAPPAEIPEIPEIQI